jgi:hypothetical protein
MMPANLPAVDRSGGTIYDADRLHVERRRAAVRRRLLTAAFIVVCALFAAFIFALASGFAILSAIEL